MLYKYAKITITLIGIVTWISSPLFGKTIVYFSETLKNVQQAFSVIPPEVAAAYTAIPLIVGIAIYTIFY